MYFMYCMYGVLYALYCYSSLISLYYMLYGVRRTEHTVQSCVNEVIGTFRKAGENRLGAQSTYYWRCKQGFWLAE